MVRMYTRDHKGNGCDEVSCAVQDFSLYFPLRFKIFTENFKSTDSYYLQTHSNVKELLSVIQFIERKGAGKVK